MALDKLVETIDCCDHALSVEPDNKPLAEIREKALSRKHMIDEKIRLKEEKEERERNKKAILDKALKVIQ